MIGIGRLNLLGKVATRMEWHIRDQIIVANYKEGAGLLVIRIGVFNHVFLIYSVYNHIGKFV